MQQFRLQSLQIYNSLQVPNWGPDIEDLDMDNIVTYVRPKSKMSAKWSEVPKDIKDTFERLGIPQAEQKSLAGVGAQYDSELVYHNAVSYTHLRTEAEDIRSIGQTANENETVSKEMQKSENQKKDVYKRQEYPQRRRNS